MRSIPVDATTFNGRDGSLCELWNNGYYRLKGPIMDMLSRGKTRCLLFPLLLRRKWTDLDESWSTVSTLLGAGRSSDSLRGKRNFVLFFFGQVNNAWFHQFPVGQILRHLNTTTSIGDAMQTFGTEFEKFYHEGSFFQKKNKKCSQNFEVLRPVRHISAVITDLRKFTTKLTPFTGCLVSIFRSNLRQEST